MMEGTRRGLGDASRVFRGRTSEDVAGASAEASAVAPTRMVRRTGAARALMAERATRALAGATVGAAAAMVRADIVRRRGTSATARSVSAREGE